MFLSMVQKAEESGSLTASSEVVQPIRYRCALVPFAFPALARETASFVRRIALRNARFCQVAFPESETFCAITSCRAVQGCYNPATDTCQQKEQVVRPSVLLVAVALLVGCSSPTASTPSAATPIPYMRHSANDVAQAFGAAGLRADTPYPAPVSQLAESPFGGALFNLWGTPANSSALPMMSVVVTSSPDELARWQTYFYDHRNGLLRRYQYLIRHNVLLVFAEIRSSSQEWGQYWAVFAAMP
jgi:hypothetical protein